MRKLEEKAFDKKGRHDTVLDFKKMETGLYSILEELKVPEGIHHRHSLLDPNDEKKYASVHFHYPPWD